MGTTRAALTDVDLRTLLKGATPDEHSRLSSGVSQPEWVRDYGDGSWCRLTAPGDVELIKSLLTDRIVQLAERPQ